MANKKVFKSREYFNVRDAHSVESFLKKSGGYSDFLDFCFDNLLPGMKFALSARPAPGKRYKVKNFRFVGTYDKFGCGHDCCGVWLVPEVLTCEEYKNRLDSR
jgi:hypothetical protein